MKPNSWWATVLALLAGPAAAATISFAAGPAAVRVGDTVWLDVRVGDVADLYAFQFDVAFDPAVLRASEVVEGSFLNAAGGATSFVPGGMDNMAGTVAFTAGTLLGPAGGASGDGVLVRLAFQAQAVGRSELAFGNVVLLDAALAEIAVMPTAGLINVSAVPEPASAVLIALGLAVLAGRRWGRPGRDA